MFDFIIQFLYKKLVSYLDKCYIEKYFFIRNFLIFNRSCRHFFYRFVDESIKLLGPDTEFDITLRDQRITVTVYIDCRVKNRCELAKQLRDNVDGYYCYGRWLLKMSVKHFPFLVDIDFMDR